MSLVDYLGVGTNGPRNPYLPHVLLIARRYGVNTMRKKMAEPSPWLGKRIVSINATVPWHLQSSGKKARKAKFAHWARKARRWTANWKVESLASGQHYLATPKEVQAWLNKK